VSALWLAFLLVLAPTAGIASEGGQHLDKVNIDVSDRNALQRGAKLFVNYCVSCHSAAFMRYSRMGRDLGLTDNQVKENLMFASEKVGSLMTVAMDAKDAASWFGAPPPDLTLSSRARGVDWLYTYLRSFYLDNDPTRPFGVNNLVFKDVAMPHVLWELQGWQGAVHKTETDEQGRKHQVIEKLELVEPGALSVAQYDRAVQDLVTFMAYLGEPVQLERRRIGVRVLLFLAVFFVVALLLKKEYWKDVH